MTDIVDSLTRSRMMAGIKGIDTKPEIQIRQYLHKRGFRFRLHRRDLPGTPDLVMPKYDLAIFVHGCFWHRHAGCYNATMPATRRGFWEKKFAENVARDRRNRQLLLQKRWRVLIIWECGLRHCPGGLNDLSNRICGNETAFEWPASPPKPG